MIDPNMLLLLLTHSSLSFANITFELVCTIRVSLPLNKTTNLKWRFSFVDAKLKHCSIHYSYYFVSSNKSCFKFGSLNYKLCTSFRILIKYSKPMTFAKFTNGACKKNDLQPKFNASFTYLSIYNFIQVEPKSKDIFLHHTTIRTKNLIEF